MATDDLLRVTRIRIDKLFDRYSHEVALRLEDRITIIHGPNGVGKTVLLKMTEALLKGKHLEFALVPFENFEVSLSDGSTLGVTRVQSRQKKNAQVTFFLRSSSGLAQTHEVDTNSSSLLRNAMRIEAETPWLARSGAEEFIDRRSGETLNALEVITRFSEYLPGRSRKDTAGTPDWLEKITARVGVHLIPAQRLLRTAPIKDWEYRHVYTPAYSQSVQYVETVKDCAVDLRDRISNALASYARESQSLDQTFPQRLLKPSTWGGFSVDDLKKRMSALEAKSKKLKQIGLIGEDTGYPLDVNALEVANDAQRSVMTLYVDDTARKLGVLDGVADRIAILLGNINRKFKHKGLQITREKGLTAVTDDGKELGLESLSSGEQHEIVLLYDLLFNVQANTLVLIDEPELSLHVTWQKNFLPDLLRIVEATRYDVLLATHSPFIVGDRTDLMIELSVGQKKDGQY